MNWYQMGFDDGYGLRDQREAESFDSFDDYAEYMDGFDDGEAEVGARFMERGGE